MKRDLQAELEARVRRQISEQDPPEAAAAFDRMVSEGRTPSEARRRIAAALLAETHAMVRDARPFDPAGYAAALAALPRILKR